MENSFLKQTERPLFLVAAVFILYCACVEFFNVAWGTGAALGQFSLIWFALFSVFALFTILLACVIGLWVWKPVALDAPITKFVSTREKLGAARWFFAIVILIFPVYFLQVTAGGVIFQGMYMRSVIWGIVVFLFASLIARGDTLLEWNPFLAALVLTSAEFMIASQFMDVTSYPFSLGWSEGNRMWDYSMLFGKDLYQMPAGRDASVLLDVGRQLVGGLPFLLPNLTIKMERFWIAFTLTIPYLLLGLVIFRADRAQPRLWVLGTLWVLIFLRQGPIHAPLVLCAALVALVWKRPLWLAIPVIIFTSYAALTSRVTWLFAPGMWIGMMELSGVNMHDKRSAKTAWTRALTLGFLGVASGLVIPRLLEFFNAAASDSSVTVTLESTSEMMSTQPLLWYRLLPNATYGYGILIALFIAILPVSIISIYLIGAKKWRLDIWQTLAILASLSAFFIVGLIVSAKIGGGGDLHNMDMFLIGLMFASVLAWYSGGREWIQDSPALPVPLKFVIALLLIIPALPSLRELYCYDLGEESSRLMVLADKPNEKSLDMRPTQETVNIALDTIREEVALAKDKGDVLFIDQRQLLTFGYIKDVVLIPEYEKKFLMNEALRPNLPYFSIFYKDLAAQRFALIVSEPLRMPNKDSSYQFGEENEAWVKYVAGPILCYYEPKTTLEEVGVQLLVPRDEVGDCSGLLP